ncbi:PilZ domain-containing protein [Nitrospirota bacterium]
MIGYENTRVEQRESCIEDVNLLITRTDNGKVNIIESEGRILDKSESGIKLISTDELRDGDSVLVNCLVKDDKSSVYSPYNIVWSNCTDSISTVGCQLNDGHIPYGTLAMSGIEEVKFSRPKDYDKEIRAHIHDLNNDLATIAMGIGLAKMHLDNDHSAVTYLSDAEKSFALIEKRLRKLYKCINI